MTTFDIAWEVCAERGECDALGGMEYTRVKEWWDRWGELFVAIMFIQSGANIPAIFNAITTRIKDGGK